MIGLMLQGQIHYESIENYRRDPAFAAQMNIKNVPSCSALRQRIGALALSDATHRRAQQLNTALLVSRSMGATSIGGDDYIPLDIDVSPMDNGGSRREHVGRTYKGCDGFAPIFAYIGTQGLLLHHELRPGSQHCQKETPAFIASCLEELAHLDISSNICMRLDSGNDSADTIDVLRQSGHRFIVKRNLRLEDKAQWLAMAESLGNPEEPRLGKYVYTGTVHHLVPGGQSSGQGPLHVAYRVIHRTVDAKGQGLIIPTIEVETYWTNLWYEAEDIIKAYHDRGTSEQYHSELKNDMGIERLPSHAFTTNQLYLRLASIAYNLLRAIGQMAFSQRTSWPKRIKRVKRRRLRSIIKDLILVGGKYVRHAGRVYIKISRHNVWFDVLMGIHRSLLQKRL